MLNERQLTPVVLHGEFHGQRSLVGYSPWGHKESDMTDRLTHTHVVLLHVAFIMLGTLFLYLIC